MNHAFALSLSRAPGALSFSGKQYELASLVVREDMRGNGIGTALVNE